MRLRIDNVPNDATERDIRQLFSDYGRVLSVTLLPNLPDSRQLGSGLIELDRMNVKDAGFFPDRCLFRGAVIRITQDRSATVKGTSENPVGLSDPDASDPSRPDNRSKNTLHVLSIEQVVDPTTGKPDGWCRYSIKSLAGSITGLRRGSVAEVTLHAEEAAEAFNLRNMLGHRRPPIWTSRQKKRDA